MNILFLAQCYAPEEVSGAVIITELATELVHRGHQVTVVTGAPNYPQGRVFPGYRNRLFSTETIDGVRVIRVWSYISPRKKFWHRIFHYGSYSVSVIYGALLGKRPEIVLSFSPPLPLGLSAWLLSRLWNVPWVLQLEDLYPDAAVSAGMLNNRQAIDFFFAIERFQYQQAEHISVISEGFRKNLLAKGVPSHKISFIPIWADPDEISPMSKENDFRSRYDLLGKFVVMYAGNIGLTSCMEDVLGAAEILRRENSIQFVIVGEGVKKSTLQAEAREKGLDNILFLPFQPREIFPEMLAAADVSLVTLNAQSSFSSLPSKTFSIMASARPILAVTPNESEVANLVRRAGCGVNTEPNSLVLLAETINALRDRNDDLIRMGQKGRMYLEKHFTRSHCVDLFETMFENICQSKSTTEEVTGRTS